MVLLLHIMLNFFQSLAQGIDDDEEFEGNVAHYKNQLTEFLLKRLVGVVIVHLLLLRSGDLTVGIP